MGSEEKHQCGGISTFSFFVFFIPNGGATKIKALSATEPEPGSK